jgi:hypothetical protein
VFHHPRVWATDDDAKACRADGHRIGRKDMATWNQTSYERSLTSQCWAFTPYDAGWLHCPALRRDPELRRLHGEEQAISPVPRWARDIMERHITYLPGCPHVEFPRPFLDVFDAIGNRACLPLVHGCYTVSEPHKLHMIRYIDAMNDWLEGLPPRRLPAFRARLWEVLGTRNETKTLLVRRLVHRLKWWCKSLVWDDDSRDRFYRNEALGDVFCVGDHYGNPQFRDPYWTELRAPHVQEVEDRLAEICPDWPWFRECIHSTWLCGPKAFRFVERILWYIGHVDHADEILAKVREGTLEVPRFLDCEDTYAAISEYPGWFADANAVCAQFRDQEEPGTPHQAELMERLGSYDPVKAWLAGLFAKKLALLPYTGLVHASA